MSDIDLLSGEPPASTAEPLDLLVRRRGFTLAELLIGAGVLLLVALAGKIVLITFGGLLVGIFLYTLAHWTSATTRLPYGWSLAMVTLVLLAAAAGVFLLVGNWVANQASALTEAVSSALVQIGDYLQQYEWGQRIMDQSPEWGKAIAQGNIPSRITDLASSIFDFSIAVVIMLFIGLYGAAEPKVYREGLVRLVPLDRRQRARQVISVLVYNLRWWILGQLFAMVCVGAITGCGLYVAGAPLALALGALAALLEIIPNIGPALWLVPAVLVSLTADTSQVLRVLIIYAVTHLVESYVLIPLVQRRTVSLPPVLSILSIMLLGLLAGFLGLLVATPLALVVMLLVKMLYVEDWLGDRTLAVSGEEKSGA